MHSLVYPRLFAQPMDSRVLGCWSQKLSPGPRIRSIAGILREIGCPRPTPQVPPGLGRRPPTFLVAERVLPDLRCPGSDPAVRKDPESFD
jgi:hypothetical protein